MWGADGDCSSVNIELTRIQKVKNSKRQKNQEKRQKVVGGRKHLSELRVVQRNLVFVIGLSPRLADSEVFTWMTLRWLASVLPSFLRC